jgi:hypothetical protein
MTGERHVWDKVGQWDDELTLLADIIAKTPLTQTVKWGAPV